MKTHRKQGMEFCLGAKVEAVTGAGVHYSTRPGSIRPCVTAFCFSAGRRAM